MSFLDLLSRVADYADEANASYAQHRDSYDENGLDDYKRINRCRNNAQRLGRNAARLDTIRTMSDRQIKEIIQDSSASSFDRRAALKVYRERKGSQSSSD